MGLPGHRRTSSDKRRRSAQFGLKVNTGNICPKCSKPIRPHRACQFCGTYKGKMVLDKKTTTTQKTKKTK